MPSNRSMFLRVVALFVIAVGLAKVSSLSLRAQASGPTAAYSFSEGTGTTTADLSGNGNTGTLSGPTWGAGKVGGGVVVEGWPQAVNIAASETLALGSAFTFETWVYPTALSGNLWSQAKTTGEPAYFVMLSGGQPYAGIVTDTDRYDLVMTSSLALNAWSHLAVTYDGAWLRIYVNGEERANRTATGTVVVSPEPVHLGQNFAGTLDEVRLYQRTLSAAEVALDMATPVDSTAPFQVTGTTPTTGAQGVLTTPVTATFSRAVTTSTVTTSAVELRDATNTVVPLSVSYSARRAR